MSKSTGNFWTIRDALEVTDFRTLRYAFLSQHYSSTIDLTDTTIENARNARRRVENFARVIEADRVDSKETVALVEQAREKLFDRLDDDFDTPGALAVLFEFIREQNRRGEVSGQSAYNFLREVNALFDTFDIETRDNDDATIKAELAKRRELRTNRKFDEADAIRAKLKERGIMIEDTPDGTRWWFINS